MADVRNARLWRLHKCNSYCKDDTHADLWYGPVNTMLRDQKYILDGESFDPVAEIISIRRVYEVKPEMNPNETQALLITFKEMKCH